MHAEVAPTMKREEVNALAGWHRENPRECPAAVVAYCLLKFRGPVVTTAELVKLLGINRSNAATALKRAKSRYESESEPVATMATEVVATMATEPMPPVATMATDCCHYGNTPVATMATPYQPSLPAEIENTYPTHASASARERATADINAAVRVLSDHINCGHIARELMKQASGEDVRLLAEDGWRLESAARKFTSSEIKHEVRVGSAHGGLKYMLGIARNLSEPWQPAASLPLRPTGTAGNVRSLADDLRDL